MVISLRARLFLGLSAVVVGSLGLVLWWVEADLAARLTALSHQDMARAGRLVAAEVGELPFSDSLADALGRIAGLRVTFIGSDGRVLGDSEVSAARLPEVENHANRPEVREALGGRVGSDRRASETIARSLLYVALPHPQGVVRLARPTEEVDQLVVRAKGMAVAAAILALLLAYPASGAFGRFAAGHLKRMREKVDSVAPGEPSRRIPAARMDEVKALAYSIDLMADRMEEAVRGLGAEREDLEAMFESLESGLAVLDGEGMVIRANAAFTAWTGRSDPRGQRATTLFRAPGLAEVVERGLRGDSASREVRLGERTVHASVRPHRDGVLFVLRDLTRLRRLEAVRRDFVANVSHELKTPLTSIMGFAEAIAESEMPDARRQEFAERILTNSRRMRRLVDDLLELTRIESGRWELAAESVELGAAARAEWAILEPLAKERSVRLAMDAGLPTVTADPGAVRQILRNLFDNALRYAPEGSEVRLSTSTVDGWVRTEISDSGPGIPSAHLARIFERFYRVDPARSREAGGTGLGLAIVKHLVRAHGGEVRAESELGRGTTVWFTLPVASSELIRVTKSLPEAFRLPIDVEKKGEGR
jgi:two-component system phosphate regulon sensor histidine kinase PhoR